MSTMPVTTTVVMKNLKIIFIDEVVFSEFIYTSDVNEAMYITRKKHKKGTDKIAAHIKVTVEIAKIWSPRE